MSLNVTERRPSLGRVVWRPLKMADVPALTTLLAKIEAVDLAGENYDADDLAEELSDELIDLSRDTLVAVAGNGELVAWGVVRVARTVRDVHRVFLEGGVHPGYRRNGLGRLLLTWQEARGAAAHRERHPAVPGQLELMPFEHVAGHCQLAARAGYTPVRWWNTMVRDLDQLPPAAALPPGLSLVQFDRGYDEAVRVAHNAAFSEHWGSRDRDPVEWQQWFTGARSFRPAVSFLVLAGSEVVAYLLSYFYEADAVATGVRDAWIGQVGTARRWRGNGLASGLFAQALASYAAAGYDRASLGVGIENTTGALQLYQRLGFVVENSRVSYLKSIG